MIVQCPYCATSYELDAARLTGKNPMLKCSRCRHVFPAPVSKKRPALSPRVAEKMTRPAEETLTLPFEEPVWKDESEPTTEPDDLKISEPEEGFTLGVEGKSDDFTLPDTATEDTPPAPATEAELPAALPKREAAVVKRSPPRRPPREEEEAEEDVEEAGAAEEPRRRESSTVTPILIFLAVVVAAYGMLARALFASPALCDRLVGRMPLVGHLGDDRLLSRKVALSDVVGSHQRIKDGKEVFVITGKALNTAPVALHSVQIAGRLYSGGGQALDEKVIYCGNVVSAKVLKDLTPREVSILQKLSPPKRFMIEPGESSTFVIVFMDPPRDAAEFSTQVVGAQHQT